MDHNDIRKGILQAKHVDENSGLLFLEVLMVPALLAFTTARLNFIQGTRWENSILLATGFFSFVFFVYGVFVNPKLRKYIAFFFSLTWAYWMWKLFGPDKPYSEYVHITDFILDYCGRAIPSLLTFLLSMYFHSHDIAWLKDVHD